MRAAWISGAAGGQSSGTRDAAARELPPGAACPLAEAPPAADVAARLPAVDDNDVVAAVPTAELPAKPEKAAVREPVPVLAVLPATALPMDTGADVAAADEPELVPPLPPGEASNWPVICPDAGAADAAASTAETSNAGASARITLLLPIPLRRPQAGRIDSKENGMARVTFKTA